MRKLSAGLAAWLLAISFTNSPLLLAQGMGPGPGVKGYAAGGSGPVHVQDCTPTANVGSGATNTQVTCSTVGNGNTLVGATFLVTTEASLNVSGCTDSSGDTVTLRGTLAHNVTITYYIRDWTVTNASNTGTHVITCTWTNTLGTSGKASHASEYSSATFDAANQGTGAATVASLAVTTAQNNEVLWMAIAQDGSAPGLAAGCSTLGSTASSWFERSISCPAATAGSNTAAGNTAASNGWAAVVVALK